MRWCVQGEVRLFQRPDVSINRLPTCFFCKVCLSGAFNDVFIHVDSIGTYTKKMDTIYIYTYMYYMTHI